MFMDKIDELLDNIKSLRDEIKEIKIGLPDGFNIEYSAIDAAKYLGISYQHFVQNVKANIPFSQPGGKGGKLYFKKSDLESFISRNRRSA